MLMVDRLGRRTLLLTSQSIVILSLTMFMMFGRLAHHLGYEWAKYGSASSLFLFYLGFSIGLSTIPWILPTEMFAQGARPAAVTFISLVGRVFALVATFSFPLLMAVLQEYTFIFFIVTVALANFYTYSVLPETKAKSIEEIQLLLRKKFADTK